MRCATIEEQSCVHAGTTSAVKADSFLISMLARARAAPVPRRRGGRGVLRIEEEPGQRRADRAGAVRRFTRVRTADAATADVSPVAARGVRDPCQALRATRCAAP